MIRTALLVAMVAAAGCNGETAADDDPTEMSAALVDVDEARPCQSSVRVNSLVLENGGFGHYDFTFAGEEKTARATWRKDADGAVWIDVAILVPKRTRTTAVRVVDGVGYMQTVHAYDVDDAACAYDVVFPL